MNVCEIIWNLKTSLKTESWRSLTGENWNAYFGKITVNHPSFIPILKEGCYKWMGMFPWSHVQELLKIKIKTVNHASFIPILKEGCYKWMCMFPWPHVQELLKIKCEFSFIHDHLIEICFVWKQKYIVHFRSKKKWHRIKFWA